MPKLANAWSTTSCNRLIAERMAERTHEKHVRAVESTRGLVDHKQPQQQPHLRSKPKTKKLQEDRAVEIQLENRVLLQRMLDIDTKPSEFSGDNLRRNRVQPRSLQGGAQRHELDRITGANHDLLRRLQHAKPSVDPRGWEDEEFDRQALKYRLSQNSCRGRLQRLRIPVQAAGTDRLPRIPRSQSELNEEDLARLANSKFDAHYQDLEHRLGSHAPLDFA